MAGAVFRPTGSSTIACAGVSMTRSCSATSKRCVSLQTMIGAAPPKPVSRCTVSCSIVLALISGSNCLGYSSRDSGHRRVPAPPDRTTGTSGMSRSIGRLVRDHGTAAPDGGILEAETRHQGRVIEIAAIEDARRGHDLLQAFEIRAAELLPLRDDEQGLGAGGRLVSTAAQGEGPFAAPQPPRF